MPLSPFEYMFGVEKRDKLFHNYFASPNALSARLFMKPDFEERTQVGVSSSLAWAGPHRGLGYPHGSHAGFGYEGASDSTVFRAQAMLDTSGSMRAVGSAFNVDTGVGAYAMMPLATDKSAATAGSASAIGFGPVGRPVRFAHLTQGRSEEDPASMARDGAEGHSVMSPTSVTATPSDAVDAQAARPLSSAPLLPELGVRYVNPTQTLSVGMHSAPVSPYPAKLWMVGNVGGEVTAGVQVATSIAALQANSNALQKALAVDAAISVQQAPSYELSLAYDSARREVVAAYIHNLTLRRRVYNVLEDRNVKGIFNYLDFGFELRRPLVGPASDASLALGAAWQINRNLLLKARLGTRDASGTIALRAWTQPALTLCATTTVSRTSAAPALGFYIAMEHGGALEYQKAYAAAHRPAPNMALRTSEHLNERINQRVDNAPLLATPASTQSVEAKEARLKAAANRML
ncbi:hypothetical protein EON62_03470 [archaeon]|nr:MAG: hypothetical protein EON62_03470 [archaeon]